MSGKFRARRLGGEKNGSYETKVLGEKKTRLRECEVHRVINDCDQIGARELL